MANLAEVAVAITGNPTSFEAALASAATKGEAFQARLSGAFGNLQNNVLATFSAIAAHPVGLIITSLTGLVGVLTSLAEKAEKLALEQASLERKFGLTNAQAAGLQLQARTAGISMDALGNAMRAVNRNLGDAAQGSGRASAALERLGLNARDLTNMPMTETLALIGDRLATVENRYERAALANAVLTRRGAELEGIMRGGTAAMEASQMQAERLGLAFGGIGQRIADSRREQAALNASIDAMGVGFGARMAAGWDELQGDLKLFLVWLAHGQEGVNSALATTQRALAQDANNAQTGRTPQNIKAIEDALERADRKASDAGLNRYDQAINDFRRLAGVTSDELLEFTERIHRLREAESRAFGVDTLRNIEMLQRGIDRYTWGARDAALQTAILRGEIQDTADRTLIWNARLEDALTTVKGLLEQSLTPAERLRDVYRQLNLALERGAITQQTYLRVAEQAERNARGHDHNRLATAVSVGSVEALTVLNEARMNADNNPQERAAASLAELVRQGDEQRQRQQIFLDETRRLNETFLAPFRVGNLDN